MSYYITSISCVYYTPRDVLCYPRANLQETPAAPAPGGGGGYREDSEKWTGAVTDDARNDTTVLNGCTSKLLVRYAPEKIPYGITRYVNETRRLYSVLDKHLANSPSGFIVGDHISIADITTIGWVIWAGWAGVDIDEFPHLKKWEEMMSARPAVRRGCDVPKPLKIKERMKDKAGMEEYARQASQWIVQGMKDDAARKE
ncbi:putative glutathione-S-transferase theta, GST [Fonsecaea pedrosoi]|nr:putative glutathione-S-transferase theta, GST [Fonsecaea pedrosoi]